MNPAISRSSFGVLASGEKVDAYTLTNAAGASCTIMTYGATLTRLLVPGRDGVLGDVVLGFDTLKEFESSDFYFGAVIGRFANRIGGGRFSIDGHEFKVAANNGANHLHGGLRGFDKVVWQAEPIGSRSLRLTHTSPDGAEGYPGTLAVEVIYTFTAESTLRINYRASTDRPTIVNLTNHAYFNLHGSGDVLGHRARIAAAAFTPSNAALVPTGEIAPVAGSAMDFREAKLIGRDFPGLDTNPRGFDHNFVLGESGAFGFAAKVEDSASGRALEVWTDQPGIQFYTGNFMRPTPGKGGVAYAQYSGFCLETQHFPDSPNQPNFPTVVLRPGEEFRSTTEFRFPRP